MTVHHGRIDVRTGGHVDTVEITEKVADVIKASKIRDGICVVSALHTTAGIFVNESADSDVHRDLFDAFERMVPADVRYAHAEGNSPAHIKSILTGSSLTLPVRDGALELGRWQGVYFAEFDGPRDRTASVTVIGETRG